MRVSQVKASFYQAHAKGRLFDQSTRRKKADLGCLTDQHLQLFGAIIQWFVQYAWLNARDHGDGHRIRFWFNGALDPRPRLQRQAPGLVRSAPSPDSAP